VVKRDSPENAPTKEHRVKTNSSRGVGIRLAHRKKLRTIDCVEPRSWAPLEVTQLEATQLEATQLEDTRIAVAAALGHGEAMLRPR